MADAPEKNNTEQRQQNDKAEQAPKSKRDSGYINPAVSFAKQDMLMHDHRLPIERKAEA